MVFKCCVESCKRTNKDVTLHSFPKEPERFSKWLSLIGRTTLLAKGMDHVRKTYRICDMHFSDDAKFESHHNRSCLKVDCVPSQYLPRLDESIQGTEEVNNLPAISTQGKKFADHAMVFMARGIRKKWKQPVAFYLSENAMSSADLARNLRDSIRALQNIGISVVATVCDQMSINTATINNLIGYSKRQFAQRGIEYRSLGFFVDELEVIPLYDIPHLLKGIRNNFLKSNVKFTWKEGEQTARWDDIVKMYELDIGDFDTRMLNKLTDQHVYADKMKVMKVKLASQVFSQRVSSVMRGLVRLGRGCLPESAKNTADFLLFVDKLFDSVNGSTVKAEHGKTLRCAVTSSSTHIQFWEEAIRVLKSIHFVSDNKSDHIPPSIKNWQSTLERLKYLWTNLNRKGFEFLCVRNLNQDPLENFFGSIRAHGLRNINPTPTSFQASYKSLLINNFMSTHSPGANCEEDDCEGALHSLKRYIYEVPEEDDISSVDILDDEEPPYYTLSQISDTVFIESNENEQFWCNMLFVETKEISRTLYTAGLSRSGMLQSVENAHGVAICQLDLKFDNNSQRLNTDIQDIQGQLNIQKNTIGDLQTHIINLQEETRKEMQKYVKDIQTNIVSLEQRMDTRINENIQKTQELEIETKKDLEEIGMLMENKMQKKQKAVQNDVHSRIRDNKEDTKQIQGDIRIIKEDSIKLQGKVNLMDEQCRTSINKLQQEEGDFFESITRELEQRKRSNNRLIINDRNNTYNSYLKPQMWPKCGDTSGGDSACKNNDSLLYQRPSANA
ncbi:thap-type zinc finger superfamily [Holotrichia oblita]|uniref:Thap-type zinc finger superfamily n=1 Tax=Holotrichia oblita TaxID=644536 RepID=A0ACB9TE47_HOLOL|nr:thap-type zinc finger superfamily [Holotrichia oblita]